LDGLVVDAGGFRRATFLPQVWEQLPEPVAFLAHLKKKAGLTPDYWAEDLRFYRYRMEEIR
jgi:AMMECR1 domain-containing protein